MLIPNLICSHGHRWTAPNGPMEFVDRECGYKFVVKDGVKSKRVTCKSKLMLIKDYKKINPPKPKFPKRKKLKKMRRW